VSTIVVRYRGSEAVRAIEPMTRHPVLAYRAGGRPGVPASALAEPPSAASFEARVESANTSYQNAGSQFAKKCVPRSRAAVSFGTRHRLQRGSCARMPLVCRKLVKARGLLLVSGKPAAALLVEDAEIVLRER
jgi:hypothetical protein